MCLHFFNSAVIANSKTDYCYLLNEAEYDVKNYRGLRWITASEICLILHIIRKPRNFNNCVVIHSK